MSRPEEAKDVVEFEVVEGLVVREALGRRVVRAAADEVESSEDPVDAECSIDKEHPKGEELL